MSKTEDEAYILIKEITLNNYQWSNEGRQPKSVGGKVKLDAISMLSTKVDVISQRIEQLNIYSISSSTPPPSCEICGSVEHLTINCQVWSPFAQDASDQVNFAN